MSVAALPTAVPPDGRTALTADDVADIPPEAELRDLAKLAAVVCRARVGAVTLIDGTHQHYIAAHGLAGPLPSVPLEHSLCAPHYLARPVTVVDDASLDPGLRDSPQVDGSAGHVRFFATSTLRTRGGDVLGTLCVADEHSGSLDDDQRGALVTLARQVVDAFELRRRDRLLQAKIDELERSQRQLVSFAGQISHDLKTPLTSIIGFAEMASDRDSVAGDEVALRYVERTQASGRRMLGLIDDLLDYARVGGTLRREPIGICAVFDQVKGDLRWAAVGAGIRTSCTDDVVSGDPSQIRLLLQNLLTNAVKYGPQVGGVITVSVERHAGGATLRFTDNGSGIPPEQRAVVLEPLARLRDDVPGTGLGLATCQRIARAHCGQLRLADTPGGGLTVLVDLPDA